VALACSFGQALIFTGEAVAVVLGGNLAYAFKANNISWRAAPLGLAVTAFLVAVAIAAFIREPKKGRFIVQQVRANPAAADADKPVHVATKCRPVDVFVPALHAFMTASLNVELELSVLGLPGNVGIGNWGFCLALISLHQFGCQHECKMRALAKLAHMSGAAWSRLQYDLIVVHRSKVGSKSSSWERRSPTWRTCGHSG